MATLIKKVEHWNGYRLTWLAGVHKKTGRLSEPRVTVFRGEQYIRIFWASGDQEQRIQRWKRGVDRKVGDE